jgi:glycosyltransferase involved in cell wall biosynthesis
MSPAAESKEHRIRLAIITTHPIQYQAPIWRQLAQEPDLDVHVFFGSDFSVRGYTDAGFGVTVKWDVPLAEGYAHTFLSTNPAIGGTDGFFRLRTDGLRGHLKAFKPDCALICAYTPFFFWETLCILRILHIPVIVRAETTDVAKDRMWMKRWLRSVFLRAFYSQCSQFLAIGQNSRAHYAARGIPASHIGWAPYCIDTDLFEEHVQTFLPRREALRRELGFSADHTVFIFSGKLIPKKDPLTLARALEAMTDAERWDVGLIVLGDGELHAEMEVRCRHALGEHAVFAGFVNQSELGRYYAAADCLVLPSQYSETWGLVVNEALQFGIPAIVSDRVGCHPDLIVPGETGCIFPVRDVGALKVCLQNIIGLTTTDRRIISEGCRQQARLYSSKVAANGIVEAVTGRKMTSTALSKAEPDGR